MKPLAFAVLGAAVMGCGQQAGSAGRAKIVSLEDSVSYVLGYQLGSQAKQQSVKLAPGVILRGLSDGLGGGKAELTDEQMQSAMASFQVQMISAQRARDSVAAIDNRKAGDAFLARNKTEPGVKTTASGLQYKVLKEGTGQRPKATSTVTVHYRGTLLDGTEFDRSGAEPVSFPLNRVIPGWTEGVQLMTPGSKYQFWIPSDLAYGPAGSPPRIGPNQTLVFEVELVSFR
ncbi:MAG TPA: FKBP-type peptidyl-prolyl cis-trans isomerase [Gemmatimonadales bacterium]|jgi:FKBP-type peptidyl-prolyl cis-trans isomerase|nr:FKBP-type peptidyl-prolyl cis-trans isomerase [Gemmatimonadales bacterium]